MGMLQAGSWAPTLTQPSALQKEAIHEAEQPLPASLSSATTAHTDPLESYPLVPGPHLTVSAPLVANTLTHPH